MNNAGAPRKELWTDDGIRVKSLNESVSEGWWPKEIKPDSICVMIAMRILKEAADILDTCVFVITDDYKSFFNQMRFAPSEYSMTGVMHPPRTGESKASFAYDTVLGFGIKMASNVAKRFADLLVHISRKAIDPAMDKLVKQHSEENAEFNRWVNHRMSATSELQ